MKRLLLALTLSCLAALMVALGCGDSDEKAGLSVAKSTLARESSPTITADDFTQQIAGSNDFGFDLMREVRKGKPQGNLFSGPVSISTALAMTYAGARGETAAEMKSALRFVVADDVLHRAFNKLDLALDERHSNALEPFALALDNALWSQQGFQLATDFLDTLALNYGAGVNLVDFMGNAEGARQTINHWIAEKTEDRIPELIGEGQVDDNTRLVLTNTIYFKASWADPFPEGATQTKTFHAPKGDVEVDMMREEKRFVLYRNTESYQAIELPYDGNQLAMVVIAPTEGNFESFTQGLTSASLKELLEGMTSNDVDLQLPRFSIKSKFALRPALESLGVKLAFDGFLADFSGMLGPDNPQTLYIDEVLHEANIDVDEKGSEAAAATAVIMNDGGVSMPPPVTETMVVDRPFVFMIRDRGTGAVLFAGEVDDPSSR